jgi:hypothetical protein
MLASLHRDRALTLFSYLGPYPIFITKSGYGHFRGSGTVIDVPRSIAPSTAEHP